MKITITVEEQIPYTSDYCVGTIRIDPDALYHWANAPLIEAIDAMKDRVSKTVASEMEKRGIKLGEDWLRLPNKKPL